MSYTEDELRKAHKLLFSLHYDFQDRYAMAGLVGDITDRFVWLHDFLKENFDLDFAILTDLSMKNVYDRKSEIREVFKAIDKNPILSKWIEI